MMRKLGRITTVIFLTKLKTNNHRTVKCRVAVKICSMYTVDNSINYYLVNETKYE